jgi:hypothetical protein
MNGRMDMMYLEVMGWKIDPVRAKGNPRRIRPAL